MCIYFKDLANCRVDNPHSMDLYTPEDFSFLEALAYLNRSEQDILHHIANHHLYKAIKLGRAIHLLDISHQDDHLHIEFLNGTPNNEERKACAYYVWELFDCGSDLHHFYQMAEKNDILAPLIQQYYGLRVVGIPDLFEAISWAIIGQQINLTFAYTLKKRLIENYGESLSYKDEVYWLYPDAEQIASTTVKEIMELQFTGKKAEYLIGVAEKIVTKELTKENLMGLEPNEALQKLVSIRGIGPWTAHYVMMRCLHIPSAFPISDVGLHNALKIRLQLPKKPAIPEIERWAKHWNGFEAYATFYLWRSLQDLGK